MLIELPVNMLPIFIMKRWLIILNAYQILTGFFFVYRQLQEVLKTWPLSTVRRWAASPNSFTLDFGDYADEYYSVSTTEGETISRLIAGMTLCMMYAAPSYYITYTYYMLSVYVSFISQIF